jgi:thiol-disulfide isomerase/thioredoxin
MTKQTKLILAGLFIVAIITISIVLSRQNFNSNNQTIENYGSTKNTQIEVPLTSLSSNPEMAESKSEFKDTTETSTNTSMVGNAKIIDTKTTVNLESGYTNYSQDKLINAKYGKVILFFHASWCPSCRALDSNIKSNINSIPNNVLILKVDYDSNSDLKQKYGVVSQHTLVQIDQDGSLLKSSKGLYQLNTLESVIQNF